MGEKVFGIEFAPNGLFLYVTSYEEKSVYQLRLQELVLNGEEMQEINLTADEIINSRHDYVIERKEWWGQMQIAPDGRIYTGGSLGELGAILRPNWPVYLASWTNEAIPNYNNLRIINNSNERRAPAEGIPNFMNGGCLRTGFLLPVDLITFEAKAINNNTVVLNWATEAEVNNEKFLVERSYDGVDFETIGEVAGNGTSSLHHDYDFTDQNFEITNIIYYRLKQIDYSGAHEYTDITTVKFNDNHESIDFRIDLYPNPVVDIVKISSNLNEPAVVALFNQNGQGITKLNFNGNNFNLDLRGLAPGTYFIYVEQGHQKITKQFIKK